MKKPRILVVSVKNALKYVLGHLPIPGVTEYPDKTDHYAAISIQDAAGGGFGFELRESRYCNGVLTLYFDDTEEPCEGLALMDETQARQIIDFIQEHRDVDTLLIHCFAGVSRSRAVGVFAGELLGVQVTEEKCYNEHVYSTLKKVWRDYYENS